MGKPDMKMLQECQKLGLLTPYGERCLAEMEAEQQADQRVLEAEAGEPLGRRATHGEFYHAAAAYDGIKAAIDRHLKKELPPPQRYALDMIAVKLARIVAGDNYHEDHWRDITGYASLVADKLERMPQGPKGHS